MHESRFARPLMNRESCWGRNRTKEERFIARILFVNRILKANNQVYQQLFWAVMTAKHGQSFIAVRPWEGLVTAETMWLLPGDGTIIFRYMGWIDPIKKNNGRG